MLVEDLPVLIFLIKIVFIRALVLEFCFPYQVFLGLCFPSQGLLSVHDFVEFRHLVNTRLAFSGL